MRQTPLAQLAEHKLGQSLSKWVAAHLKDGKGWRRISQELHTETGVLISYESLRTWYAQQKLRDVA